MRKRAILRDLLVDRVDAVARPASGKKFLLLKEEVDTMEDRGATAVAEQTPTEAIECVALTPEDVDLVKSVLAKLYPLFEEGKIPDGVISTLGSLVGYPTPSTKAPYPKPAQPAPKEKEEAVMEKTEAKVEAKTEVPTVPPELLEQHKKTADELAKAQERLKELEAALAAEKRLREERDFEAEVKGKIPTVASLSPEVTKALFALKKADPEKFPAFLSSVEKLEGFVKSSPLLKELGSTQAPEETPWDVLDRKARELIQKGMAKTIEEARVKILSQDPELYRTLRK